MQLEQKYQALLAEAERRKLDDVDSMRLCFQTLSLAARIDRDCAALLAPHGLSEGRFVLLFLLESASEGLAPNHLAEQAGITRATVTGLLDGLEREAL
ncbi:MarR family transcriptional regulator, partial [Delftia sp. BR1]